MLWENKHNLHQTQNFNEKIVDYLRHYTFQLYTELNLSETCQVVYKIMFLEREREKKRHTLGQRL